MIYDSEKGAVPQATSKLSVLEKATQQSGINVEKANMQAALCCQENKERRGPTSRPAAKEEKQTVCLLSCR
jgi:hypothetical protein